MPLEKVTRRLEQAACPRDPSLTLRPRTNTLYGFDTSRGASLRGTGVTLPVEEGADVPEDTAAAAAAPPAARRAQASGCAEQACMALAAASLAASAASSWGRPDGPSGCTGESM